MNPLIRSSRASFARITLAIVVCMFVGELNAADAPARIAIVRALDLDVNETKGVELANGTRARVKLLRVDETRDALRDAVRQARVQIELNGQSLVLTSATYHLPVTAAGVQIDCPITKGYVTNSSEGIVEGRAAPALAGRLAVDRAGHIRLSAQTALVRQPYANGQRTDVRRWR